MDGDIIMNKRLSWSLAIIVLGFFIALSVFTSVYGGDKPTVLTAEALAEDNGNASLNGQISDPGRKEITRCGFKWGNTSSLGKEAICQKSPDANRSFSVSINDLQPGTTYYFQAFAVNPKGSAYGDIKSFTVPIDAVPTVTISSPEDNLSIVSGEVVKIAAAAADDKKVESMKLYINDSSASSIEGDVLTYDWDTGSTGPGKYVLKVSADDGNQEEYKSITVSVEEKPAVTNLAVNDQQPAVTDTYTESTSVSRSKVTDTYTYPNLSKVQGSFGQFYYRDTSGGRIEIDPAWIAENIVTITLPGLNQKVQVHKDAADNFITAFNYIKNGTAWINGKQVSLLSLIKTMDGTFVTRHVNWDSARGLSNHSWGIAIDINAADHFRYVDPSWETTDPNLILWEKAFKPAGFSWGNSYSDSMHFELLN